MKKVYKYFKLYYYYFKDIINPSIKIPKFSLKFKFFLSTKNYIKKITFD
jgi:hypothetical protein